MPFLISMPKLSPTMEAGMIAKWHKKEGDLVRDGELLVEVATDKATIEYNALDGGYLRKILVPEGGTAAINQPIAVMAATLQESIEGVGAELAPKKEEKPVTPALQAAASAEKAMFTQQGRVNASPLAKKLAKQRGIDLATVQGSGPRGRITSRDLSSAKQAPMPLPSGTYREVPLTPMRRVIAERLTQAKNSIPHIYVRQEVDALALYQMREELIAGGVYRNNLKHRESGKEAPRNSSPERETIVKGQGSSEEKNCGAEPTPPETDSSCCFGIKVSFNDLIIKASALALRDHPAVNSGYSPANQSILLFSSIDISVAVTVPGGLITPIVRNADAKSVAQISTEVKQLATKAKEGKLRPEEYQGGSFTISNLGMFGITDFCAIINPPQAAILAVGGIDDTVRVQNGQFALGKKMNLVLSADHRVVDGVDAAQFLKTVQKYLERPALLGLM